MTHRGVRPGGGDLVTETWGAFSGRTNRLMSKSQAEVNAPLRAMRVGMITCEPVNAGDSPSGLWGQIHFSEIPLVKYMRFQAWNSSQVSVRLTFCPKIPFSPSMPGWPCVAQKTQAMNSLEQVAKFPRGLHDSSNGHKAVYAFKVWKRRYRWPNATPGTLMAADAQGSEGDIFLLQMSLPWGTFLLDSLGD